MTPQIEPGQKSHAKEQKVKTHKANNPEPIPARFIEYAHEWYNTDRRNDWRRLKTLDEWRAKYKGRVLRA